MGLIYGFSIVDTFYKIIFLDVFKQGQNIQAPKNRYFYRVFSRESGRNDKILAILS